MEIHSAERNVKNMEELVRGYVYLPTGEQRSFYFRNSKENIANFIMMHGEKENRIAIENIFGKAIVTAIGKNGAVEGDKKVAQEVKECLLLLQKEEIGSLRVEYLDLSDLNGVDEFDSHDMEQKLFEDLCSKN